MSACVDTMFSVREVPWHGMGEIVKEAPTSEDAIRLARIDWTVEQKPIFLEDGTQIEGSWANVRSSDGKPLGVVGSRYQIVQNADAFAFTDALLGEGVKYETAGSLKDGKVIWLLARMPETINILGDEVAPYLVFTNTHDGTGSVKVTMTNVRICCANTLNMAIRGAKRVWSARHTGSINNKLDEAMTTLQFAHQYIEETKNTFEQLNKVKISDFKLYKIVNNIIPITDDMTDRQKTNQQTIRDDILYRYKKAPDLSVMDKTGARLVHAVADTTSHMTPLRETKNYKENHFKRTLDGNDILDRTVSMLLAA